MIATDVQIRRSAFSQDDDRKWRKRDITTILLGFPMIEIRISVILSFSERCFHDDCTSTRRCDEDAASLEARTFICHAVNSVVRRDATCSQQLAKSGCCSFPDHRWTTWCDGTFRKSITDQQTASFSGAWRSYWSRCIVRCSGQSRRQDMRSGNFWNFEEIAVEYWTTEETFLRMRRWEESSRVSDDQYWIFLVDYCPVHIAGSMIE